MALFRQSLLGVELSDSLFKLVELQRIRRKVRLKQIVIHPLPPKWMQEGKIVQSDELILAIREALIGRNFRRRRAYVALNSSHTVIKKIKVPEMKKRKLRKMLRQEVIPRMELPFSDPLFDFYSFGDVWEEGDLQDAVIVAASFAQIRLLIETMEQCGLEPIGIDLAPLANMRWLRACRDELPRNLLLVQLAKSGLEISYFENGVLRKTGYTPLHMAQFKERPDYPYPDPLTPVLMEAQEIERYGKALLKELERYLDCLGKEEVFPTECVLTGEGIDFSQLQSWMIENMAIEITLGPGVRNILSESLHDQASRWLGSSLSVPVGLGLKGGEQVCEST